MLIVRLLSSTRLGTILFDGLISARTVESQLQELQKGTCSIGNSCVVFVSVSFNRSGRHGGMRSKICPSCNPGSPEQRGAARAMISIWSWSCGQSRGGIHAGNTFAYASCI